jgi:3-dehydroquinate synthetase
MGMFPVGAVFGLLPTETFTVPVDTWNPISIVETQVEHPSIAVSLPFKIGGLALPMLNHNSNYHTALQALVDTLERHYSKNQREFFPIVSCGETCDALGYGSDLLALLTGTGQRQGYYFAHKSGETFKCPSSYADPELFACLRAAKLAGVTPLIIAVGGGVNGNSIGLIAALAGADFIEVPTTPMHFNDATTSAKKAFSLVRNNVILSKNIMGAFYLPLMVYCCSDMFLTLSSANAHATVGEATKTMNMLGVANSVRAAADYHNILGACEFASDFTKILLHSEGFNKFVSYIRHPNTQARKREILELGERIANLRKLTSTTSDEETSDEKISEKKTDTLARSVNLVSLQGGEGLTTVFSSGGLRNVLSVLTLGETEEDDILPPYIRPSALGSPVRSLDQLGLSSVGVLPPLAGQLGELLAERTRKMDEFRSHYYNEISISDQQAIKAFLTTINTEIVSAKAMFLAYSDPFEKYRALLFEYAHTLGHGIEAFANSLYVHAKNKRIPIPEEAERLHGQCVGMAVLWAGAMSSKLGSGLFVIIRKHIFSCQVCSEDRAWSSINRLYICSIDMVVSHSGPCANYASVYVYLARR